MLNELLWKCLYVMDSILTFAFACDICTTLGMGECPNKYWLLDLPFTLDCTDWMSSLACKSMTTLQKWCGNCLILWIMFSCLLVTDRPSKLCHSAVCIAMHWVTICCGGTVHCRSSLVLYLCHVCYNVTVQCIRDCYTICYNVSPQLEHQKNLTAKQDLLTSAHFGVFPVTTLLLLHWTLYSRGKISIRAETNSRVGCFVCPMRVKNYLANIAQLRFLFRDTLVGCY